MDDRLAALRTLDRGLNIAVMLLYLIYLTDDHNIFMNKVNIIALLVRYAHITKLHRMSTMLASLATYVNHTRYPVQHCVIYLLYILCL